MLKLIEEYEKYVRWRRIVLQWIRINPLNSFKECARELYYLCERYNHEIIREVKNNERYGKNNERYGMIYRMVCEDLGTEGSIGIAILAVELPLNWKLSKLRGLLGLIPHRNKKYNHKLRSVLTRTAIAIYLNKKRYKRMS